MTNQFIQNTKWNGSTECMKIQGDEPSCIPICKGHMTKTWWVCEKEGKPKGKQERGKLSFGPCLRRYLIL